MTITFGKTQKHKIHRQKIQQCTNNLNKWKKSKFIIFSYWKSKLKSKITLDGKKIKYRVYPSSQTFNGRIYFNILKCFQILGKQLYYNFFFFLLFHGLI